MNARFRYFVLALVVATMIPHVAVAQSLRDLILSHHRAYLPDGDGVFPTLIVMPGCSGVSFDSPATDAGRPGDQGDVLFRRHYPLMADRFRDEGFAVLLIDILSAEGVDNACNGEISGERISEYISETVIWVEGLTYVDKDRIHLIGYSMGGGGVLTWFHNSPIEIRDEVRSAVVVYPDCKERKSINAQIPLLMLLGGSDDIADPNICEALLEYSTSKPLVTLKQYAGARHGFDIVQAPSIVDVGHGKTLGYKHEAAMMAWQEILQFIKH